MTADNPNSEPEASLDSARSLADPAFLKELRASMVRFATQQLGDSQQAEDAVQEALAGALRNARTFKHQAALRTWVFAILKHKIIDLVRRNQRRRLNETTTPHDHEEDIDERLFNSRGRWDPDERPGHWSSPTRTVYNDHFWRVFEVCLDDLPPAQSRAFMMREFMELDGKEICAAMDISTSNFHVLLYRARLRLRECLSKRWYNEEGST